LGPRQPPGRRGQLLEPVAPPGSPRRGVPRPREHPDDGGPGSGILLRENQGKPPATSERPDRRRQRTSGHDHPDRPLAPHGSSIPVEGFGNVDQHRSPGALRVAQGSGPPAAGTPRHTRPCEAAASHRLPWDTCAAHALPADLPAPRNRSGARWTGWCAGARARAVEAQDGSSVHQYRVPSLRVAQPWQAFTIGRDPGSSR
jgi:hypothetical protein